MEGDFTAMTKHQMEWVQRVVERMLELTAYYGGMEQPLKDEDYEYIKGVLSGYTQKSRNNEFIICCSVTFAEYLDEIGKKKPAFACLDREQMQKAVSITDVLFEIAIRNQDCLQTERQLLIVEKQMAESCKELWDHPLIQNLEEIFKNYLFACMEKNIGMNQGSDWQQMEHQSVCGKRAKNR